MKNKLYVLIVGVLFAAQSFAISFSEAQEVFDKLSKDNNIKSESFSIMDSEECNAYNAQGRIFVTPSMLKFMQNKDEAAWVLGHELGHNTSLNEMKADSLSAKYMKKSGYNLKRGVELFKRWDMPAYPKMGYPLGTKDRADRVLNGG
jgi:predicted Zn-dependent protease